jgi:hypothetical protein
LQCEVVLQFSPRIRVVPPDLIGEYCPDEFFSNLLVPWFTSRSSKPTCVVDLSRACVHRFEQLVDFLVRHFLAQVGQDVLELADADEACHVLIKHLETAAVLIGLARLAEPTGAVKDALECLEVDYFPISLESNRVGQREWSERWDLGWERAQSEHHKHVQSPPTFFSRSLISERVGFWPQARRRSPRLSSATRPLPRLSNRLKASL